MKKNLINSHNIKKWTIPVVFLLFMIIVISHNIQTYYSIRNNTGYTMGIISETIFDSGERYVKYEYNINGKKIINQQAGSFLVNDRVLVVYDTTACEFSMIATYPSSILIDNNNIIKLDTNLVDYKWRHYLPY